MKKYANRTVLKDAEGNPRVRYYTGQKSKTLFGLVPLVTTDISKAKTYADLKEAQSDRPGFAFQSVLIMTAK